MTDTLFAPPPGSRIAVAVSGGVDSSVAAYLLKKQGHDVFAIFMKNWEETPSSGYCAVAEDLEDARDVCATLAIPLHTVNFVTAYQERVFKRFLEEYRAGRTPNPDVLCNREIKFAELADYAHTLRADYLATGHYARRMRHDGRAALYKGCDGDKDQSYFLHQINPLQLSKALFPLGALKKPEVRRMARSLGLVTFDKKDSTGICFIGERPFRDFLRRYLPAQPGEMQTPEGVVVGEHGGLMYYTIGQRQGLGIGGVAGASQEPWYVLAKDLTRNVLVVGQGEHPLLYHRHLIAGQLSWIDEAPLDGGRYLAKTRYRQPDQACRVTYRGDRLSIRFERFQRAVTPGQYLVLYAGQRCLGGGVIEAVWNEA